jgi:site-specific recombinase XerD
VKQPANTLAAYRRDLAAVDKMLARRAGCSSAAELALDQVTGRLLRAAFADFAEPGL